jgi:hypothetical protein
MRLPSSYPDSPALGKRSRNARTRVASALTEIISSGENPRRHASQNVISSNSTVSAIFGHAFNPHSPCHVNCSAEENGARYGIGYE